MHFLKNVLFSNEGSFLSSLEKPKSQKRYDNPGKSCLRISKAMNF